MADSHGNDARQPPLPPPPRPPSSASLPASLANDTQHTPQLFFSATSRPAASRPLASKLSPWALSTTTTTTTPTATNRSPSPSSMSTSSSSSSSSSSSASSYADARYGDGDMARRAAAPTPQPHERDSGHPLYKHTAATTTLSTATVSDHARQSAHARQRSQYDDNDDDDDSSSARDRNFHMLSTARHASERDDRRLRYGDADNTGNNNNNNSVGGGDAVAVVAAATANAKPLSWQPHAPQRPQSTAMLYVSHVLDELQTTFCSYEGTAMMLNNNSNMSSLSSSSSSSSSSTPPPAHVEVFVLPWMAAARTLVDGALRSRRLALTLRSLHTSCNNNSNSNNNNNDKQCNSGDTTARCALDCTIRQLQRRLCVGLHRVLCCMLEGNHNNSNSMHASSRAASTLHGTSASRGAGGRSGSVPPYTLALEQVSRRLMAAWCDAAQVPRALQQQAQAQQAQTQGQTTSPLSLYTSVDDVLRCVDDAHAVLRDAIDAWLASFFPMHQFLHKSPDKTLRLLWLHNGHSNDDEVNDDDDNAAYDDADDCDDGTTRSRRGEASSCAHTQRGVLTHKHDGGSADDDNVYSSSSGSNCSSNVDDDDDSDTSARRRRGAAEGGERHRANAHDGVDSAADVHDDDNDNDNEEDEARRVVRRYDDLDGGGGVNAIDDVDDAADVAPPPRHAAATTTRQRRTPDEHARVVRSDSSSGSGRKGSKASGAANAAAAAALRQRRRRVGASRHAQATRQQQQQQRRMRRLAAANSPMEAAGKHATTATRAGGDAQATTPSGGDVAAALYAFYFYATQVNRVTNAQDETRGVVVPRAWLQQFVAWAQHNNNNNNNNNSNSKNDGAGGACDVTPPGPMNTYSCVVVSSPDKAGVRWLPKTSAATAPLHKDTSSSSSSSNTIMLDAAAPYDVVPERLFRAWLVYFGGGPLFATHGVCTLQSSLVAALQPAWRTVTLSFCQRVVHADGAPTESRVTVLVEEVLLHSTLAEVLRRGYELVRETDDEELMPAAQRQRWSAAVCAASSHMLRVLVVAYANSGGSNNDFYSRNVVPPHRVDATDMQQLTLYALLQQLPPPPPQQPQATQTQQQQQQQRDNGGHATSAADARSPLAATALSLDVFLRTSADEPARRVTSTGDRSTHAVAAAKATSGHGGTATAAVGNDDDDDDDDVVALTPSSAAPAANDDAHHHDDGSSSGVTDEMVARRGVCGLTNVGNTCYMNSALQCLSNLPQFRHMLLALPLSHWPEAATTTALVDVLAQLWCGRTRPARTRDFKDVFGRREHRFANYQQQDANEFVEVLLDRLNEELNRVAVRRYRERRDDDKALPPATLSRLCWDDFLVNNTSAIPAMFFHQSKTLLRCLTCDESSVIFDNNVTLSVNIKQARRRRPIHVQLLLYVPDDTATTCAAAATSTTTTTTTMSSHGGSSSSDNDNNGACAKDDCAEAVSSDGGSESTHATARRKLDCASDTAATRPAQSSSLSRTPCLARCLCISLVARVRVGDDDLLSSDDAAAAIRDVLLGSHAVRARVRGIVRHACAHGSNHHHNSYNRNSSHSGAAVATCDDVDDGNISHHHHHHNDDDDEDEQRQLAAAASRGVLEHNNNSSSSSSKRTCSNNNSSNSHAATSDVDYVVCVPQVKERGYTYALATATLRAARVTTPSPSTSTATTTQTSTTTATTTTTTAGGCSAVEPRYLVNYILKRRNERYNSSDNLVAYAEVVDVAAVQRAAAAAAASSRNNSSSSRRMAHDADEDDDSDDAAAATTTASSSSSTRVPLRVRAPVSAHIIATALSVAQQALQPRYDVNAESDDGGNNVDDDNSNDGGSGDNGDEQRQVTRRLRQQQQQQQHAASAVQPPHVHVRLVVVLLARTQTIDVTQYAMRDGDAWLNELHRGATVGSSGSGAMTAAGFGSDTLAVPSSHAPPPPPPPLPLSAGGAAALSSSSAHDTSIASLTARAQQQQQTRIVNLYVEYDMAHYDVRDAQLRRCMRLTGEEHDKYSSSSSSSSSGYSGSDNLGSSSSGSAGDDSTLQACLTEAMKPDTLAGNDAWYCPRCKTFRDARVWRSLFRLPPHLFISFKRFKMNAYYADKNDTAVSFPLRIDFAPYLDAAADRDPAHTRYRLRSVIYHSGSLSFGHYTAMAYNDTVQGWVQYNDTTATPLPPTTTPPKRDAYILCYERVDVATEAGATA